jgi:predicted nucleotidyltransferase
MLGRLTRYLDEQNPGGMLGLYLTGSAVMGGLRPNSDVDLVLVTRRSLTRVERQRLGSLLLETSQAGGGPVRSLEFTSVTVSDVVPWTYPPVCDLLFGEWLREAFARGSLPQRNVSPDLAIMLGTLLRAFEAVRGPVNPGDLLDPIPDADVRRAILDSLPSVLSDLVGDERNVILTLARMLVTMSTGEIVSKDQAADRIGSDLPEPAGLVVSHAAAAYVGRVQDDWSGSQRQVEETAEYLAARIRDCAAALKAPDDAPAGRSADRPPSGSRARLRSRVARDR